MTGSKNSKHAYKSTKPAYPPSKRRSATDELPVEQDGEDDDVRTDVGTPGRKDGPDPEWRSIVDPGEETEVTCGCWPEWGDHFDDSVGGKNCSSDQPKQH